MEPNDLRLLIAGAGIGGLTTGIALRQAGFRVDVFEQAEALRPVGWGLLVQANALAALRAIGVHEQVIEAGVRISAMRLQDARGRTLFELPMAGIEGRLGLPMVAVHRGRLQAILQAAFGSSGLHLGRGVDGFEASGDAVTVTLRDGGRETGQLLVGADGLHSRVRARMRGEEPLRYAGYTCWRGLARGTGLVDRPVFAESWGCGLRFGYGHLRADEVYWFALENAPAGGLDAGSPRAMLLERFRGWHEPVTRLIAATSDDDLLRTDINDRPPIDRWTMGPVALLGDAAHPMTPNLGQGACQAIEDGVVLAGALVRSSEVMEALADYERRRIGRTRWFVEESRRFGATGQLGHPVACWLRDAAFALTPPGLLRPRFLRSMTFSP